MVISSLSLQTPLIGDTQFVSKYRDHCADVYYLAFFFFVLAVERKIKCKENGKVIVKKAKGSIGANNFQL